MKKENKIVIGLDFDGTVVKHRFPEIGEEVDHCVSVLKDLIRNGHKIVLNTMRSKEHLDAAVSWFKERGIELFGVNVNPTQKLWTSSPKVYAHLYIDDAALGVPLIKVPGERPWVDWEGVREFLFLHDYFVEPILKA